MQNPSPPMGKPWKVLAGVLCILGICAVQAVLAEGQETFTNASLQGTYAYANSVSGVASLGPITFDGHGRLTAKIKVMKSKYPAVGAPLSTWVRETANTR